MGAWHPRQICTSICIGISFQTFYLWKRKYISSGWQLHICRQFQNTNAQLKMIISTRISSCIAYHACSDIKFKCCWFVPAKYELKLFIQIIHCYTVYSWSSWPSNRDRLLFRARRKLVQVQSSAAMMLTLLARGL